MYRLLGPYEKLDSNILILMLITVTKIKAWSKELLLNDFVCSLIKSMVLHLAHRIFENGRFYF